MVDHPAWQEQDNVFGSPICDAKCFSEFNDGGTAGPRSGSAWAWFGGLEGTEQEQGLFQIRTFAAQPVTAALSFYVRVGRFENESAVFSAKFDGVPLFTIDKDNQADYAGGYTRVVVPLEDPVPGMPHQILFRYDSEAGVGEQRTNINVDDVTVETTYLRDGDFEAAFAPNPAEPGYYDSPGWTEATSEGNPSPICGAGSCGFAPGDIREPHSGDRWTYFGFSLSASVSQVATTPALTGAALTFHLLGQLDNPAATMTVKLDGATKFTLSSANKAAFLDRYRQVVLPLGDLAAGAHPLTINWNLPSNGQGPAKVNLDDVALVGAIPPPATPAPIPTVPAPDPPQTRIAKLKLLAGKDEQGKPSASAKFRFSGSGGSGKLRFQCKLDKGKFKACTSPKTYKGLKPGKHSFQVRAVDATGASDATPAKRSFQIAAPKLRATR